MLSITLEGGDALDERLQALPTAIQAAMAAKAADLAARLQAHVVQDKLSGQVLQARTGALRASISADISLDDDRVLVRVFSSGDIKYAAIQEFGGHTPAHDIVPNKARALAFTVGGRMVFAKVVHHPGSTIPQRSYLRSSLADMENQIVLELKAAAVGALTA